MNSELMTAVFVKQPLLKPVGLLKRYITEKEISESFSKVLSDIQKVASSANANFNNHLDLLDYLDHLDHLDHLDCLVRLD